MRLNDGAFVAVKDGQLMLGHVDRPFDLWRADAGVLVLLAEIARGTPAGELPDAMAAVVGAAGESAVPAALAHLRRAHVVADGAGAALRDVNAEVAKVIGAAPDLHADTGFMRAARACEGLTLTSAAAQYALWSAVRHVIAAGVPGALVECGVWRGGSMLLAALALLRDGVRDRDLFLFDTFGWSWERTGEHDGFMEPGGTARAPERTPAEEAPAGSAAPGPMDVGVSADEVHARITAAGYPADRVHCVAGLVQDTLPARAPDRIALLRLDTDQYESTLHELRELYPRVAPGGLVIIDDYGKLAGATRAADAYLAGLDRPALLHRIDTQGRIFVKPDER
ncbi:TylF/MycF/NovP-related O-methyltransferase [Streptomyces marincola]|uniref:TylF/MycF/NovP-related O-methyltransferase n=1 Tax=Streptomyces marincola TaxID=2878388 RepID=UPI001CF318F1|nr:TylF/MycF/NovP-related O-methyltransferase [Streptomyces marincola]UCM88676.1 TylF/MycF family methyltransferase [Streptomyces marincola]